MVSKAILRMFNTKIKAEPNNINKKVFFNLAEKANTKDAKSIITLIALQPSIILAKYLLKYKTLKEDSNSCFLISQSLPKKTNVFLVCCATNSVIPSTSLFSALN